MSDYGPPVAQNINPNPLGQGLTTLGNLLSIKQQQQQLQTGQYIQQSAQAEAQKGQQAMGERQAVQTMFQTGKDDQGNDIRDANGEPDPSKVLPALGRMAPLTGQPIAQSILKTYTDKTGLQAASTALDQSQRQMLGQVAGANIGNPQSNSADFNANVDNLVAKHPEMSNAANYVKSLASHVDNTTDPVQKDQAWRHIQMLTQDVGGQQAQQNPIPGTVSTGMQVLPTTTERSTGITRAANAPPVANLVPSPGERLPHIGSNAAGQTVAINPLNPNQMAPAGSGQAPTYPGVKAIPSGVAQTPGMPVSAPPGLGVNPATPAVVGANKVAQESAGTFSGNVAAASKVPQLRNALQNIIRLSDQVTSGPETDRVNKIKAMVGNAIPGSNGWQNSSSAYQEMTKYMEQAALASWGAAGGTGTNEQYEAQKMANPNNQYNSVAVKSLAKWVLAGQDAQQSKTNAMLKWAKEPGNGPQNQYDFENKWANVLDPRAFQVAHMTPHEALEAFPNKSDRDEIRQNIGNLKQFMSNPTTQ